MKLVYFAYPYSDSPQQRFEEVQRDVRKILKKHDDWVPIIPHWIDALFGFPQGYSAPELFISDMDLELIARCDIFVYSPKHLFTSKGVNWELSFAKRLKNRGKIEIRTYEELI